MKDYKNLIETLRNDNNCDVLDYVGDAADAIEELLETLDISHGVESLYREKLERANEELRNIAANGVYDQCMLCAHCCTDGEPIYLPSDKYMEHCDKCDKDCSEFLWRGMI